MPRQMSSAMLAAAQSGNLQPALFVSAEFITGPIYLWTGYGSVVWGGNTWLGAGSLGTVSGIEEGTTVEARGITIALSGIDPALLGGILSEFRLGAPASVYLGFFSGSTLIADPVIAWSGRMDQPTLDVSGGTAVIAIGCESRLLDLNVSVAKRLTSDQQQLDHPGDRGLEFVASLQNTQIFWGRVPANTNSSN